eukprot:TRINITY_DN5_c0_g2_i1.p1 TRINITY_DN5_c0_g2~~TRINITY_DN5_c0_g2_i1.p1  ORF type:complete len:296 (-),score=137.07 TRINITY_DN5_c0_g2_i1:239-1126(-)
MSNSTDSNILFGRKSIVELFAGSIAGVVADAITHPADTIRARLQVQKNQTGTLEAFALTINKDGWKALYRGFPIVATFTVPAHGFYFFGYEVSKRALRKDLPNDKKPASVHFLSGIVAELCGALLWTPMDVVKQRLQVQGTIIQCYKYNGSIDAIKTIFREEGINGLYRGFGAGLLLYGPFVGMYFVFYEQAKIFTKKHTNYQTLPMWMTLFCGASASACAAAITTPLDVVKTRIQVQKKNSNAEYNGMISGLRNALRHEGRYIFTKGLLARVLWVAPGSAITMAVYEKIKYNLY